MKSSIFVVDDHPLYCDALVALIQREQDLEVCGVAHTASKAQDEVPSAKPDLVLIDIGLRDGSGLDLMHFFRNILPDLKMLTVSGFDETIYAERVLRAGATGYIMKAEGATSLIQAIRSVLRGDLYLSEVVRQRFIERQIGVRRGQDAFGDLTDRELEVYRMIGEGMSTGIIADHLNLSPKTVDSYRRNAQVKLGLSTAKELLRHATVWRLEQTV